MFCVHGQALVFDYMCAVRFHQQRLVEAEEFCRRGVAELQSRGVAVERIIPEVVAGLRARRQ